MKKIIFLIFIINTYLYCCTGISINQNDFILQARTIEYAESNLNSKLIISPKNKHFVSILPNTKKTGIEWNAKYGYVGISVIDDRFIAEGINEAGLNAGLFYFPHYGSLEKYDQKHRAISIVDMQFVSYLLSNFKNIDEVKKGIKKIKIVNIAYDNDNNGLPTAHYRVADSDGKNIVIEIINNGEIKIYDNLVGVLTNSPDYEWHVKNLNNYVNLKSGNYSNFDINNHKIFSFGAGTGALGLPGDITPPSRFVRAFYMISSMPKMNNLDDLVKSAFHILNNFDIPIWIEYDKKYQNYIPKDLLSATQWTSVSVLKQKEFYYKTMNNAEIRKVDLNKIDFANTKYQIINLDTNTSFKEITID